MVRKGVFSTKFVESSADLKVPNVSDSEEEPNVFQIIANGWKVYFHQNITLASISYVLLFINGVTPGIPLVPVNSHI
jgi:hypothetical protein